MDTDSYKLSHYLMYPEGLSSMFSYFEARGGLYDECTVFGLTSVLNDLLEQPWPIKDEILASAHGVPFNVEGWKYICKLGYIPVRIRAIPEGLRVPVGNCVLTVESTDPKVPWITNWIETALSRLWYPSTIAMQSHESRKILMNYLEKTSDDPESEIDFKLHDFGCRGVTCRTQAAMGGAAHLLSFKGTDTIPAIEYADEVYRARSMPGFSIPATEHSIMTMLGPNGEFDIVNKFIDTFLKPGAIAACVADSYDVFSFAIRISSDPIKSKIEKSGGTFVMRPDSGDPIEVLRGILHIFSSNLEITANSKGYRMLPPWLRLIWGDGIDQMSMLKILEFMDHSGWSASNIAFGSGGGLLQKVNRDTQKWAFKCSSATINGREVDVYKDPVTSKGKRSKPGRLDLILNDQGHYVTTRLHKGEIAHPKSAMRTVFDNGNIWNLDDFDTIRERLNAS